MAPSFVGGLVRLFGEYCVLMIVYQYIQRPMLKMEPKQEKPSTNSTNNRERINVTYLSTLNFSTVKLINFYE